RRAPSFSFVSFSCFRSFDTPVALRVRKRPHRKPLGEASLARQQLIFKLDRPSHTRGARWLYEPPELAPCELKGQRRLYRTAIRADRQSRPSVRSFCNHVHALPPLLAKRFSTCHSY